jgi:hypothetical protein
MNWIAAVEKRRLMIIGGILLVSFSALGMAIFRNPVSLDAFWHLQMGRDWIEQGLSPWVDHYSFTFAGHPISNPPVAFQALLHFLVSQFELRTGFMLVKALAYALVLGGVLLLLRQIKAPAIMYALVLPVIVLLLQMRSMVRPELFGYAFSVFALVLYFRAEHRITARTMLPIAALMLVWSNYHSSVVGYVIFAGLFLDAAVFQLHDRAGAGTWLRWLAWGMVVLLVGFLNLGLSHPLLDAITFPSGWKSIIHEYLPLQSFGKTNPGMYLVALLALLTPLLAFRQRRYGFLLIWVVLAYAAVSMQRMLTPAGLVIFLLLTYLLVKEQFPGNWTIAGKKRTGLAGVFCLLLVGGALYASVAQGLNFMRENKQPVTRHPVSLVDYMIREDIHGRIFNDYGMGGYLIYRLAPRSQVYIDGRTQILYPLEHMRGYKAAQYVPEVLKQEFDEYQFDLIISAFSQSLHDVIMQLGEFQLDFVGPKYALYRRGPANFPRLGELFSDPACWRPEMQAEIEAERNTMDAVLPFYSGLHSFAEFVTAYGRADNRRAYLDQSIENEEWSDEMRRFAAYRFFEEGEYEIARMLFGGLEVKKAGDYLAPTMAMMLNQDWALASRILKEMTVVKWKWLKPGDILIYYALISKMGEQQSLTAAEEQLLQRLDVKLTELGMTERSVEMTPAALCN